MPEPDLAAFENDMDSVLRELDGLVARQQARQAPAQNADGSVSFDVSGFTGPAEDGANADFLALLNEAQAVESGAVPSGDQVSFGFTDSFGGKWAEVKVEFDAFMEKINRDVLHFATIETEADGKIFARSQVDWSGDAVVVFAEGASDENLLAHSRQFQRELMQKNLRLRMFATVATAAGKITLMLTTPGAAVMALPLAYKYVSQLSEQWKSYQSVSQS
jgi:hypothetical protein